ncbi:5'-nucleotidase C-terminal domain-containing protein [Sandaracinus amylolyticus]|uniref:5'-nucleotidase C-terminal domain-containing protein n=1 Tax=Sandaracinus amylolyticus TaxID=927083 RepID=UPI00069D2C26|nr:5'-nucleotidase C-terminal domain-containing protein [Sandaracinus amylolyticus]
MRGEVVKTAIAMLAIAVVVPVVARAQSSYDVQSRTIARVLASGGIGGRFGRPLCQHGLTIEPSQSALFTYALVREARSPDAPMVLDTGGLLAPHGVARFAAVSDPTALAELVDRLGYRALAFGVEELGAPRASLLDVIRSLRRRRIPSIATNLRCEDEAVVLCDLLVDAGDRPSVHVVDGRPMAVLAFLPDDAATQIAPENSAGLSIVPIAERMPEEVRTARAMGAEVVVAVAAIETEAALELARELPEDGRPDLLLLAGSGELLFARPSTVVPAIAEAPRGDAVEILIREGLLRAGYEMVVQPLGGRGIDVGEPVLDFLDRIGEDYCAEWGRVLGGGLLTRELDANGLAELAARVVLEAADADVSVINLGAIDERWRTAREDALTASDLYIALEYDEPLVVADVPASWVVELARRSADQHLVTPGLERDGDGARVLGRPVNARATYRVVTLRFLASGGDGALPALPEGTTWSPLDVGTLRSVVLERLQRGSELDAREALEDPAVTPEWIVSANADGSFSGSSIDNPRRPDGTPLYDSALLNRGDTIALGLEINLRADATAPDWSWENSGLLRYRAQWTPSMTPGVAGAFAEAVDQIQLRSLGAWRGLRVDPAHWYVPDAYAEIFLESELSEPPGRGWHWMLFRPTIGARFPLTSELDVKLSTGLQAQLLDPNGEAEWGVGAVVQLRPWDIARIEQRHVTLQGLLDWFVVDLGDQNRWQLRGSFDAMFDLAGPLALTLGVRLYMQQERADQLGVALDATAGLRLGWLGRAVGPEL